MAGFQSDQEDLHPSSKPAFDFADFPEDVQISILSFLSPQDVAVFSSTCKRLLELCSDDAKVWLSMCQRRWGSKTHVKKWSNGRIRYRVLYKTLEKYENLIGFWRRIGQGGAPLVFFEWGESFITGSRVLSYQDGSYEVVKIPFLWMGLSTDGDPLNLRNPHMNFGFPIRRTLDVSSSEPMVGFASSENGDCFWDFEGNWSAEHMNGLSSLVNVNFVGKNHIMIEGRQSSSPSIPKNRSFCRTESYSDFNGSSSGGEELVGLEGTSPGSSPDFLRFETYQYLANRTSPVGERATRRQRRKDRERAANKWEAEHYVKIADSSPTPARPLQGLWKGICDSMSLVFFLVSYDDLGGLVCRKIGDTSEQLAGCSPVFWTSNSKFVDSPLSSDEDELYSRRIHVRPLSANCIYQCPQFVENEVVMRSLCINSSYDFINGYQIGSTSIPRKDEGRVWQYIDGAFGFGLFQSSFIIDLKRIEVNNHLLDVVQSNIR
ncbi:F-box protein [Nymphaea thermarum]|nr:F-box protein [Nymphaea thermarum]